MGLRLGFFYGGLPMGLLVVPSCGLMFETKELQNLRGSK